MSNQQEPSTEGTAPSEESTVVLLAEKQEPSQHEVAICIADRLGETEGTPLTALLEENTESPPSAEKREPSQQEIAMQIADRLGEVEDARRKHIMSLVRTLGRTQAQALQDEALHMCEQGEKTAGEVFCDLAYTKGKLKASQVWGAKVAAGKPYPPSHKVVARKIGKRLGETKLDQSILLKHVVSVLGPVQAWALMLDALEIEAHGGMMVLSDERRRTVGGIFFYLVSTGGIPGPGKVLKRNPPKDAQKPSQPGNEDQPKKCEGERGSSSFQ